MDELFEKIQKEIGKKKPLIPITLPEELARIKLPLGLMDMHCYNYKSGRVRKIYFMRFKAVPSLDVFGMGIHPDSNLDVPIFVCDLSGTRKRVLSYINFVPLLREPPYLKRYIEPMKPVFDKYSYFPRHKVRDWMRPYLSPYAIYSMAEKTSLEEIKACALDYLTLYVHLLSQAEEIRDPLYQDEVGKGRDKYLHDLTTIDASRKMLGRIIGMDRADRIFHEVIT